MIHNFRRKILLLKCYTSLFCSPPTPTDVSLDRSVQDPCSITAEVQHRCPDVRRFLADGEPYLLTTVHCADSLGQMQ